jgi:hypothetical protein
MIVRPTDRTRRVRDCSGEIADRGPSPIVSIADEHSGCAPVIDDGVDDSGHGELFWQRARGPCPQASRPGRLRLCEPLCQRVRRYSFGRSGGFPVAHTRGRARNVPGQRQLHRNDFDGGWNQGRHGEHSVSGRAPCQQLLFHHGRGERRGKAGAGCAARARHARRAKTIRSSQSSKRTAAGDGRSLSSNERFHAAIGCDWLAPHPR